MILVQIQHISTAHTLIQSADKLAEQLGKSLTIISFVDNGYVQSEFQLQFCTLYPDLVITFFKSKSITLIDVCEQLEASFLIVQLSESRSSWIKVLLKECRTLRIPYLFYKDSFARLDLKTVILPVGFLEEELEKAQFASAFGRFCGSEIKILLANDYGTKAKINAEKMQLLFDKFELNCSLQKAQKDSFKVEMEAARVAEKEDAGLVIVSASRDYGLDDMLFGPKELHVVRKSTKPVLLINPRADLYALCD
jgi:hypothetical protein